MITLFGDLVRRTSTIEKDTQIPSNYSVKFCTDIFQIKWQLHFNKTIIMMLDECVVLITKCHPLHCNLLIQDVYPQI